MTTSHDIQLKAIADAAAVCRAFVDDAHTRNASASSDDARATSAMEVIIGKAALAELHRMGRIRPWNVINNPATGTAIKIRDDQLADIGNALSRIKAMWSYTATCETSDTDDVALAEQNVAIWDDLIARVASLS